MINDAEEHQRFVSGKRRARMNAVDKMPAEVRALVHDYGLSVVKALLDVGVTKPRHIRHVVETILDEFSPTRGSFASQGIRNPLIARSTDKSQNQE